MYSLYILLYIMDWVQSMGMKNGLGPNYFPAVE